LGDEYISTEHILLALADKGSGMAALLPDRDSLLEGIGEVRGPHRVTSPNPEDTMQALEKFGRDLTAEAEQGKLDPVIGRDEEIRRVIQVLPRRAPWTQPTSSSRCWRGASCARWGRPPSTSTASTSRRTRRSSAASSRSWSASPTLPTRSRSCAGSRSAMRYITGCGSRTPRSSPPRPCQPGPSP